MNQAKILKSVSELLQYAHFVDDGIVILKDGTLLSMYEFNGLDDLDLNNEELDSVAETINRMMLCLEDGWMVYFDEIRIPYIYSEKKNFFQNFLSEKIEAERVSKYLKKGDYFENISTISFAWKSSQLVSLKNIIFQKNENPIEADPIIAFFQKKISKVTAIAQASFVIKKINSQNLFNYLNFFVNGFFSKTPHRIYDYFLDTCLAKRNLNSKLPLKFGNWYVGVLSIANFSFQNTRPGILKLLSSLRVAYRWSSRFVPLTESTAASELKTIQKNWSNKVKGLAGIFREVFSGKETTSLNQDALEMKNEVDSALSLNAGLKTRFGYFTSSLIIFNQSQNELNEIIENIVSQLGKIGFSAIAEDLNALDGWLGSLPGHGLSGMRRIFLHSFNLAHLIPAYTLYTGATENHESSLLSKNAPPTFIALTETGNPFRFFIDEKDVGHQIVLGPTGAGKSTYLDFLIVQFLRYKKARVFIFDKDCSHQALTCALGGNYFDFNENSRNLLAPFSLESPCDPIWLSEFVQLIMETQKIEPCVDISRMIIQAIKHFLYEPEKQYRSLSFLIPFLARADIKQAMENFLQQVPILNGYQDEIGRSTVEGFEMGWILSQKKEHYLPILIYLLKKIEQQVDLHLEPTLIIFEEAWLYLENDFFKNKLKDWLKTMRKKNVRVLFATQSLSDLYSPETKSLTPLTATLLENCPTKIFLPNLRIEEESKNLYKKMGLSERQIEIISQFSSPKKHYYIVRPSYSRLIDLDFKNKDVIAKKFLGLSRKASLKLLEIIQKNPENWFDVWMHLKGNSYED